MRTATTSGGRNPAVAGKTRARRDEGGRAELREWAEKAGWQLVFLRGEKRAAPGIVDAVAVRPSPEDEDTVQIRLVQLRGKAGLAPAAEKRLEAAADHVEIEVLHVFRDAKGLCFSAPILPAWHAERRGR